MNSLLRFVREKPLVKNVYYCLFKLSRYSEGTYCIYVEPPCKYEPYMFSANYTALSVLILLFLKISFGLVSLVNL
jgi:hypothetical protein